MAKDFEAWQQSRVEALTKNLSRFGRERFGQRAGAVFESNAQWAAKYQAGQEEVYADSVFQAGLDTERDVYLQNINDPKLMEESRQRIFESIQKYGQDKGMPQEAVKQLYKRTMSANGAAGVQLFIDSGDLPKARTLLEHNRIYFAPDEYAKMKKSISDEQERLNEKWEKQQFNNKVNGLVGNGLSLVQSNINAKGKEEVLYELDMMIKQNASGYEEAQKAYDILKKAVETEYEKKENAVSVFGQKLLQGEGTAEQKTAYIQSGVENGEIDEDTGNILEKIVLQQDYKTTDYSAYHELQDNIVKGVYEDSKAFFAAAEKVRMTAKDRSAVFEFFGKRHDPDIKLQAEEDKEMTDILNFPYQKPSSQSKKLEYSQKKSRNIALYTYKVRQFSDENGRQPTRAEKQEIVSSIVDESILVPAYNGERNVSFIEALEGIAEEYTDTTGKVFDTEQQINNARNVLYDSNLPVTDENVLRILGAENADTELENIREGKDTVPASREYVVWEDQYNY